MCANGLQFEILHLFLFLFNFFFLWLLRFKFKVSCNIRCAQEYFIGWEALEETLGFCFNNVRELEYCFPVLEGILYCCNAYCSPIITLYQVKMPAIYVCNPYRELKRSAVFARAPSSSVLRSLWISSSS